MSDTATDEKTRTISVDVVEQVTARCAIALEVPADLEGEALQAWVQEHAEAVFCQLERAQMQDFREEVDERFFSFTEAGVIYPC